MGAANLLKPSLLQTNIDTIDANVVRGKLGKLAAEDLKAFDIGLRKALVI
jgi:hypothetical protein